MLKVPSLINLREEGSSISSSDKHPLNAFYSMKFTEGGIIIRFIFE